MKPAAARLLGRVLVWLLMASALAAVFVAYQSPHLAVDLANRIWACF